MRKHLWSMVTLWIVVSLGLLGAADHCWAKQSPFGLPQTKAKADDAKDAKTVTLPKDLDSDQLNAILAQLSDVQVRRLLIEELKKSATAEQKKKPEVSGFTQIVQELEESVQLLRSRLAYLESGAESQPDFLPEALAHLQGRRGWINNILMFAYLAALFVGALAGEWLYRRATTDLRRRIQTTPPTDWTVKAKRLALGTLVDLVSMLVFAFATLFLFFLFLNFGEFQRLVLMTYLVVVLSVRGVNLLAHFVLAPNAPALRLVPLQDDAAHTCHRWVMWMTAVLGMGFLVRALMELKRVELLLVILTRTAVGLVFVSMIIFAIWRNREPVAGRIRDSANRCSAGAALLRTHLAAFWHLLAIAWVLVIWVLWVFHLLLGRTDLVIPIFALLAGVPVFLALNWAGQKMLDHAFGAVQKMEQNVLESIREDNGVAEEKPETPAADAGCPPPYVHRLLPLIRRCLSISLAGLVFFGVLRLWGFDVHIGTEVMGAALEVLIVVSLSYLLWKAIEAAISRKLEEAGAGAAVDDEHEMGGEGGSRIGTLLQLLRKFLLVTLLVMVSLIVLSAVGVNIGPLIAGAGVIGIALGFGTQTLVKDIVSGIFYLIDDAFRLGDYVDTGKAKGTVEHISIRSLRLRHSRGMVHTIPFSGLGQVTNFSRDYIIEKLDFRVPYDTDVNKVKKIIKKISQEIDEDPELGPRLLGPVKFQGVKLFEESAMAMRIKFTTRPGEQFIVRREVFSRLRKAFEKHGLDFASRHVVVRLPKEMSEPPAAPGGESPPPGADPHKQLLSSGAAAAIAMVLAEEEAALEKAKQEPKS